MKTAGGRDVEMWKLDRSGIAVIPVSVTGAYPVPSTPVFASTILLKPNLFPSQQTRVALWPLMGL